MQTTSNNHQDISKYLNHRVTTWTIIISILKGQLLELRKNIVVLIKVNQTIPKSHFIYQILHFCLLGFIKLSLGQLKARLKSSEFCNVPTTLIELGQCSSLSNWVSKSLSEAVSHQILKKKQWLHLAKVGIIACLRFRTQWKTFDHRCNLQTRAVWVLPRIAFCNVDTLRKLDLDLHCPPGFPPKWDYLSPVRLIIINGCFNKVFGLMLTCPGTPFMV